MQSIFARGVCLGENLLSLQAFYPKRDEALLG